MANEDEAGGRVWSGGSRSRHGQVPIRAGISPLPASIPADGRPFSGVPSLWLRQVFWLRGSLLPPFPAPWPVARGFVPRYSGGTAPESHRVPCYALIGT